MGYIMSLSFSPFHIDISVVGMHLFIIIIIYLCYQGTSYQSGPSSGSNTFLVFLVCVWFLMFLSMSMSLSLYLLCSELVILFDLR